MQQIYRRTPMPKCDFNKVAKVHYLFVVVEKLASVILVFIKMCLDFVRIRSMPLTCSKYLKQVGLLLRPESVALSKVSLILQGAALLKFSIMTSLLHFFNFSLRDSLQCKYCNARSVKVRCFHILIIRIFPFQIFLSTVNI